MSKPIKIGIMQPYFFPYLGYFGLIAAVDEWIVFNVTQYTPKTWMNRNRILHPSNGWMYVTVPLANSSISIKIHEARVLDLVKTKKSVLGKLSHYRKKAPFYDAVHEVVQKSFDCSQGDSLVSLNISALNSVCHYLGLPFSYKICSELAFDFPDEMKPGDWAPHICNELGITEYINPAGGKDLFDVEVCKKFGIKISFFDFSGFAYDTSPYTYEPDLSILDVMMWNSPEKISCCLKECAVLARGC